MQAPFEPARNEALDNRPPLVTLAVGQLDDRRSHGVCGTSSPQRSDRGVGDNRAGSVDPCPVERLAQPSERTRLGDDVVGALDTLDRQTLHGPMVQGIQI